MVLIDSQGVQPLPHSHFRPLWTLPEHVINSHSLSPHPSVPQPQGATKLLSSNRFSLHFHVSHIMGLIQYVVFLATFFNLVRSTTEIKKIVLIKEKHVHLYTHIHTHTIKFIIQRKQLFSGHIIFDHFPCVISINSIDYNSFVTLNSWLFKLIEANCSIANVQVYVHLPLGCTMLFQQPVCLTNSV